MEMSKNEFQHIEGGMSPAIQCALNNGYTIEQAIEAVSVVGENTELVLGYLFEQYILK